MEYEISDEDVLFDDSTNPSLDGSTSRPVRARPPAKGNDQKGVAIPEEEHQLA